MMHSPFLQFLLAFAATAQSAAIPNSHVLHGKRDSTYSKQPVRREMVASSTIPPMRIGLKQSNPHRGPDFLMDMCVSLPGLRRTGIGQLIAI
jgi:tripeptidyl-peptidase I